MPPPNKRAPAEADAPGVDWQTLIRRPAGYCESVVTILAIRLPRLGKETGRAARLPLHNPPQLTRLADGDLEGLSAELTRRREGRGWQATARQY